MELLTEAVIIVITMLYLEGQGLFFLRFQKSTLKPQQQQYLPVDVTYNLIDKSCYDEIYRTHLVWR